MKRIVTTIFAIACAMAFAFTALADTWTDPDTGIEWNYTVSDGKASLGTRKISGPAISRSTTGTITIPSSLGGYPVTSIGGYAFYRCSALTSVTIPSSVTNIGNYAFEYCSKLTSVTIPSSVTNIGHDAFYGCSGLTSVAIPSSVTSIGEDAFWGCSGLTSVAIPPSVTSIGYGAFSGCSGLKSFSVDVDNPSYKSMNGLLLTKDGRNLIASVNGDGVTIPSSVTSIGNYALYNCTNLTSVTIPSSVTNIGRSAFTGCSGLNAFSVDVDNPSYKSMNGLLLSKDGQTLIAGVNGDVTIPSGVTSIGNHAFRNCSGLTSVTIPSSVTNIGDYAFYNCSGLTSVTIPSSVTNIGDYAFYWCSRLTSVTIPSSVTSIGGWAFQGCSGLTSVTIPSSVMSIGYQAFRECSGLTSVTIPEGVTSIGTAAFYCCRGLTSVTIPASVTIIGDFAFEGCRGLTSVTIPEGVTSIGSDAFSYCSGLTSVAIPSSVTSIGDCTFACCSGLTSVTIPASVTSIGFLVFSDCSALTSVDFEGAPPSGVADAQIKTDTAIRYNVAYENEWQSIIAKCGWTNATAYVPEPDPEPEPTEDGIEVVFVVPNGVGSMSVATYATNSVYGRLPEARREGFTFAGWYASLDGTKRVTAFSAVDPDVKTLYARWVEDDASLYAQWEANRYSVSFNANGGNGTMAAQPFLYDQAQALSGNAFTKLGYTFKGWSAVPDGEVVYANGASVSNLTAEAGFAVALFAKWEKAIDVGAEEIEEWVGYTLAPKFKKAGETNSQYRKRFESTFGDDYSAAFFMETGKIGMDGTKLQVWHDYVAGTDPLDSESQFKASVTVVGGKVVVSWTPELSAEEAAKRVYKTLGKVKLTDENWVEVPAGSEGDYNFFKVTVEMK